jgi:hypothetical protein
MTEPVVTLTSKQREVIGLAIEGVEWKRIAVLVKIPIAQIEGWRKDELFAEELTLQQERRFAEVALLFRQYVADGFTVMHKIAMNEDNEYGEQIQYKAAKELISLPMSTMESLKLLEVHRDEVVQEKKSRKRRAEVEGQLSLDLENTK